MRSYDYCKYTGDIMKEYWRVRSQNKQHFQEKYS